MQPNRPSSVVAALALMALAVAACGASAPSPSPSPTAAPTAAPVTPVPVATATPGEPAGTVDPIAGSHAATAAELAAHRALWQASGAASYTWVVGFGCECTLNGAITVTVVDGQVTAARSDRGPVPADQARFFPLTVAALFDRADETLAQGGTVTVTWKDDGAGALPEHVAFDPVKNAIDDELYVDVTSLEPAVP